MSLRFLLASVLCLATLSLCAPGIATADFFYPDFSSINGLNLVGTTAQVGAQIHLTQSLGQQIGGLYRVDQEMISDGFDVQFTFQITNPADGADGLTFLIQNESASALQTNGGTTLGYANATAACGYLAPTDGITQSLAVEFDTWDSGPCYGEPGSARHVAVHSQGILPNSGNWNDRLDGEANPPNFEDGATHAVRVVYDPLGPVLRVYLDDLLTPLFDVAVDLPALLGTNSAWVGFTGTTGGVVETNAILDWNYTSTVPVTHDSCLGAIEMELGETFGFDTGAATSDGIAPSCGAGAPVDVWYKFTPVCDGDYQVSLCGSSFDTRLAIYDGAAGCPVAGSIECNDDSCGAQSELTFTAAAGSEYYFQVGGAGTATGTGAIALTQLTAAPINDECVAALAYTGPVGFSTECANSEGIDPGCGTAGTSPDVWFEYTVTQDAQVTVSLVGSLYDTVLAVWGPGTGCPSPGDVPFDCNDDAVLVQSRLIFNALAGDVFQVQATGFAGATGIGSLEITEYVPADVTGEHVVINGEIGGLVDSTTAMVDALTAAGITPVVINAFDTFIGTPDTFYFIGGTFPDNTQLVDFGLGDLFATMILSGSDAYVSGGDIWGFDPGTGFFAVDGIDEIATVDGGDTHIGGQGIVGGPLDGVSLIYTQDQAGNDWTDELVVSALDTLGPDSTAVFQDDGLGGGTLYNVLTFYDTTSGGKVVCGSTEIGGYDSPQTIYAAIADFFGGSTEPEFRRGDCNNDAQFNIADAVFTLSVLFPTGPPPAPACNDSCDANDDGNQNIADAVAMLSELFPVGPPAPLPAPGSATCGEDPTADTIDCVTTACP